MDYRFYYGIMDDKETKVVTSLVVYFKLWESFDYFTFMSDDSSVYRKGNYEKSRLLELCGDNWILREICTLFCQHDGSLGQSHKPVIADYLPKLNEDRIRPKGVEYIDGVMITKKRGTK